MGDIDTIYVSQTIDEIESELVTIIIEIFKTPLPKISRSYIEICYENYLKDSSSRVICAQGENIRWYDADTNLIQDTSDCIVLSSGKEIGATDTFFVSQTIDSTESPLVIVKTHIFDKYTFLIPDPSIRCSVFDTSPIVAFYNEKGTVNWYNEKMELLATGSRYYPELLNHGENIFNAQFIGVDGCKSELKKCSVFLSEVPVTHIIGSSHVCEDSFNEIYTLEKTGDDTTKKYWKIKGNTRTTTYSEINNTFSVDWDVPGIDTVIVIEVNKYGCLGADTLVVTVSETEHCTVGIATHPNKVVSISPVPASDRINISSEKKIEKIELFNTEGLLVKIVYDSSIEISHLSSGKYVVLVYFTDGSSLSEIFLKR